MNSSTRKRGGFSRLELLAATTLIAICAAVLLNRLAYYQEVAEKARVEYTISMMKSALRIEMATLLVEGRTAGFALLERQNPMDWLADKPGNYLSAAANLSSSENFAGFWHFEPGERTLTYWPIRTDHLRADATGQRRIRLKVLAIRNGVVPMPGAAEQFRSDEAAIISLRLQVEPYQWFK